MTEQSTTPPKLNDKAMRRAADQLVRLSERAGNLSKRQRATFARLIAVSTRNYYEAILRSEAPKLRGKSAEEISKVFEKHYSETAASRRRAGLFQHVIDHRTSLLKEARSQARQAPHRDNFALLFYATYFEHWINGIIWTAAKWRGVTDKEITSILREAPLRGKLTWVVRLLNLPRLKPSHVNKLLDLAEHRNAYVHYKWCPIENDSKKAGNLLRDAEAVARYLMRFENRVVCLAE